MIDAEEEYANLASEVDKLEAAINPSAEALDAEEHDILKRSYKLLAQDMKEFFSEELELARKARIIAYRGYRPIKRALEIVASYEERLTAAEERILALEKDNLLLNKRCARAEAAARIKEINNG